MCGTIALYDKKGNRLHTAYIAASPEYGKQKFQEKMSREIERVKARYPKATTIGLGDGAKHNWTFLEQHTDEQALDFWHASQYVHKAADAYWGFSDKWKESKDEWLEKWHHTLKHETMIGGIEEGGKRGRGTSKEVVVIAVEIKRPKGFGRIRMRHIPDASSTSLGAFVREAIEPKSILCTDGWRGYYGLSNDYIHRQTILSSSDDPAHVTMPGVHQVASLLKRWLLGTHQGACAKEHLQSYLEEFTFRFNRRTSHSRGQLFRRLLEQAVVTPPVTQERIHGGYAWNTGKQGEN